MDATRPSPTRHSRVLPLAVLAAAVVLGAFGTEAAATVYKWSDAQGRIHYTDRPPPPDGKLLSIDTSIQQHASNAGYAPPPRMVAAPPPPGAPQAATQNPAVSPQQRQAVAADVAAAQVEQCKSAQDRYARYLRSRHLFREGPNKEQIFLSDSEIETERLNAKREVDEACAGSSDR